MADPVYRTYPEFDPAGPLTGEEPILLWQNGSLRRIDPQTLADFVVKIGGELLATSATPVDLDALDPGEGQEVTLGTQTGKGFVPGDQILVASNVEGVFIRGLVTAYEGDEITFTADIVSGEGVYAQWTIRAEVSTQQASALALKAPLASPALTGTPTAPTATPGNSSSQIANTAFVMTAIAALLDSAPATLDTLKELATALGDDPNFAATVAGQIGALTSAVNAKANANNAALTGNPTAPTAAEGDADTSIATTAFVDRAVSRGYRLRGRTTITSSQTYNVPAGVTALFIRAVGGGGGGGGAQTNGNDYAAGGGGGAGEYGEFWVTSLASSYAITIGVAGAAGASSGGAGGSGGSTIIAGVGSVAGGGGGGGRPASGNLGSSGTSGGDGGGTSGQPGGAGLVAVGTGVGKMAGNGGSTIWGNGGLGPASTVSSTATTGRSGTGNGSGGSGAMGGTDGSRSGGGGRPGRVEIWEYVGGPV